MSKAQYICERREVGCRANDASTHGGCICVLCARMAGDLNDCFSVLFSFALSRPFSLPLSTSSSPSIPIRLVSCKYMNKYGKCFTHSLYSTVEPNKYQNQQTNTRNESTQYTPGTWDVNEIHLLFGFDRFRVYF